MSLSLLQKVAERLAPLKGAQLDEVAAATAISYDTLLRIKSGGADPAFGKVQRLAEHFGIVKVRA